MRESGHEPTQLHNNCSGKHAGFLALADELGDAATDYIEPTSRAQRLVHARAAGVAKEAEDRVHADPDHGQLDRDLPRFAADQLKNVLEHAGPARLGAARTVV